MKAIYRGLMWWVGPSLQVCELLDVDMKLVHVVDWGDPDLIIDPTDDEVASVHDPDYDDSGPRTGR